MGKASRTKTRDSGVRRVKRQQVPTRTFAGLPGECDWVAMREIVPAATATATMTGAHKGKEVTVATVLPMAWPAMNRVDGHLLLGLQTTSNSDDVNADMATALTLAADSEPGTPVASGMPAPGDAGQDRPHLLDVLDPKTPFTVTVHEDFNYWLDNETERTPEVTQSLEQANASIVPTARMTSVEAAYWCRIGAREHLRWVLPDEEELVMDAFARMHHNRELVLNDEARYLGAFRAHGLVVPVWDLAIGTTVEACDELAAQWFKRYQAALNEDAPLTADQRRTRAGVVARQVTV